MVIKDHVTSGLPVKDPSCSLESAPGLIPGNIARQLRHQGT